MNKKISLTLIFLLLAIIGMFIYSSCTKNTAASMPFKTETIIKRDIIQYVNATGNLQAKDQISVGSLVAGRVIKIFAQNNDIVKKDQVLIQLDNGIGKAGVNKAQGALDDARARYAYQEKFYHREKKLFDAGQISKNNFEIIERDLLVAKASVQSAQAALDQETQTYNNLFIKAPDRGTVIAKRVNLGQSVTAQLEATVLYEIALDLTDMEAWINVDEADIGMVHDKQEAVFSVDSFPKERFKAFVKEIQYQAKIVDNVVTFATILSVKNNDLKLRPGMTTNVDIQVAQAMDAPSISNKALRINPQIVHDIGKNNGYTVKKINSLDINEKTPKPGKVKIIPNDYIWTINHTDKTIEQIAVQIGISDGKFTHIISPLQATAVIISDFDQIPQDKGFLKALMQRRTTNIGG